MASVRYTATRSLHGVSAGTVVDYTIPVRWAGLNRSKRSIGTTRLSMTGLRERYQERVELVYSMQTKPLTPAQQLDARMFLDSVERSEQFLFSPAPADPYSAAYLESLDYDEPREPARDSMISYSITIAVP